MTDVDTFLAHYGVLGMHWGIRKDRSSGISRSTDREAAKDAKEFARAKMYYGEGAGTRRKLIKATVESKSKKDAAYKKAFEQHLANQDLGEHAAKARGQRKRTDVAKGTAKTARGIKNILLGNPAYASMAAIVLVGAFGAAKKAGVDKMIVNSGKKAYTSIKNEVRAQQIKRMFKQHGWQ